MRRKRARVYGRVREQAFVVLSRTDGEGSSLLEHLHFAGEVPGPNRAGIVCVTRNDSVGPLRRSQTVTIRLVSILAALATAFRLSGKTALQTGQVL